MRKEGGSNDHLKMRDNTTKTEDSPTKAEDSPTKTEDSPTKAMEVQAPLKQRSSYT